MDLEHQAAGSESKRKPLLIPLAISLCAVVAIATWLVRTQNRVYYIPAWQKSYMNLKEIGEMCALYADEQPDQRLPRTLGDLAPTEDIELRTFLYPFYNDDVPKPAHPTTQEAIKRINDNSDYIYLGANKIMTQLTATDVLAYNKLEYSQKDHLVNVLFGDGHVERVQVADLLKMLSKKPASSPSQ